MHQNFHRLHTRGRRSRGLVVDRQGMMIGPECVIVRYTASGFRCVGRAEAAVIQQIAFSDRRPDWLFDYGCRIAKALGAGNLALAQIYGVHASTLVELSDQQVACLAKAAAIVKAGFNPDEARDWHGRWTTEGNTANTQVAATRRQDRKSQCIDECYRILERWEPPGSYRNTWDFHNCVNECMERDDWG
jgi:hypothetical protein